MGGIRIEIVVDHQGKEQRLNLLRQPDESLTDIINDTLQRLNLPRNPPYWIAFSGGKPQRLTQSLAQTVPGAKSKDGAVVLELRVPPEPKKDVANNKSAAGNNKPATAPAKGKPAKVERTKDPDLSVTQPMPKSEAPAAKKSDPAPAKADAKKPDSAPAKADAKKPAKKQEPPPPEPVPIKVEALVNYKEQDLKFVMECKGNDSLLEILHDILSELNLPRNPPSWAVWSEDQPHRLIETLERAVPKSVAAGVVKLEVIAGESEVDSWSPLAADTDLDLASGAMYEGARVPDLIFGGDESDDGGAPAPAVEEAFEDKAKAAPAPPPPAAAAPALGRSMPAAPAPEADFFQNEEPPEALDLEAAPVESADDQFLPGARDESRPAGSVTGIPGVGADLDEMPSSTETLPMPPARSLRRRSAPSSATENRHAAVRYYSRMNPARAYALAVVISDNVLDQVDQEGVAQAASSGFKTSLGALVEIEPILPGCYVYPAKREVRVRPGDVVAKFTIVPHLEGEVLEPQVIVRQDGLTLAEIPLEIRVVKQTLTWALGVASFLAPLASAFLRYQRVDLDAKVNEGLGLFTNLIRLFFGVLPPELLWLLLLAVTAGLYFTLRPQQRDLFWELKTVTPDTVLARAQKKISSGERAEGLAMIESLLQTHPEYQAAWLASGDEYFAEDNLEEALRCYDQALALGPAEADYFSRAIKSATKLNRHERAHTLLVQARKCLASSDFKALQALLQG